MISNPNAPRDELFIGPVTSARDAHRVAARVDGTEVWFESTDAALTASAEGYAGAMLLPALKDNRRIVTADALEPDWVANTRKISGIFSGWWPDYPGQDAIAATIGPKSQNAAVPPTRSIAACFSGGIDSFYTQLIGEHPTDFLVFVHGFDIHLDDHARFNEFEPSFRRVARELGKKSIILRTNLTAQPAFAKVSWEHSHGSALAAVGHALGDLAGTFLIPSSFADLRPWGSDPRTDPLWSTSRVQMVHVDPTVSRKEKIYRICREPILFDNLRICYEHLTPGLNCSRCYKCLRVMTFLSACGVLEKYKVFDQSEPLAQRFDDIPYLPESWIPGIAVLVDDSHTPRLNAAIRGLIERTRRRYHPPLIKRAVRQVRSMMHAMK